MILLSFDIEEFDTPNRDFGKRLSWEEQISLSEAGCRNLLALLDKHAVSATFFCTAKFAQERPLLIQQIVQKGHELASHTVDHAVFTEHDPANSKKILEAISGSPVSGIRFPRMQGIDPAKLSTDGYLYDSSLNPCYIPGRYHNWSMPRTLFFDRSIWVLPASVTPTLRIPLFWLSFHHFPFYLYRALAKRTHKKDRYLNLYFHPWEFIDLHDPRFGLSYLIRHNSGNKMIERFDRLLVALKKIDKFSTIHQFLMEKS